MTIQCMAIRERLFFLITTAYEVKKSNIFSQVVSQSTKKFGVF